ncbi:MAG: DmsC/YnfH family molybdoenzyme membrane anchor subunit [Acidimicrobiia bacterium]
MTILSSIAAVDPTPVDQWIAAQADLSAVERFAQRHEGELLHRQERYYRDLLPTRAPQPGQQYGFAVDLDACTGCKACVAACHSLNGLDDGESWRTVTTLTGGVVGAPRQQTATAACHHCVDPACLAGCPVDAYEKDPITGIVAHLDDQCIGCSYCTLTCPYEVPVYNHRRGIVRKCDMCASRLAVGEAPACVQACPNGAIAITIVDTATVVAASAQGAVLPGAPPSAITAPTTVYRSVREHATGDGPALAPPGLALAPPDGPARRHTPLAVMLVLTQLSVGAFVVDFVLRLLTTGSAGARPAFDAVVAAAAGAVALGASVLHLGRPQYAYRAVIGLRHSWLSREVVAFGAFMGLAALYATVVWLGPSSGSSRSDALGAAVALLGISGVACSVLIYTTTHRSSWRPVCVTAKFACSAAICGLAAVLWASNVSALLRGAELVFDPTVVRQPVLLLVLAALVAAKALAEATVFRHRYRRDDAEGSRRARLLTRDLRSTTVARFSLGVAAGVALPLLWAALDGADQASWLSVVAATLVLTGVVASELAERTLFFTAASAPR